MKKYDAGIETRKQIIASAARLFITRGYRRVSFDNVAEECFVNRQTVYYHFPNKECLRYETQRALFNRNLELAMSYTEDATQRYLLAIYFLWEQMAEDEHIRAFMYELACDYPEYKNESPLTIIYREFYKYIFQRTQSFENVEKLRIASAYGHTVSLMILCCENPGKYTGEELFMHGIEVCAFCFQISPDISDKMFTKLREMIPLVPREIILAAGREMYEKKE